MTDDGEPAMAADGDLVTLDDAAVMEGELRHQLGVTVARPAHASGTLVLEAVPAEHREHRVRGVARARGAHRVRRQVFPLRHPELDAVALTEPSRVARVVGVI